MNKIRRLSTLAFGAAAFIAVPGYAQTIPEGQQLLDAVRKGDGGMTMSLLSANPTLINTRDSGGDTPLLVALQKAKDDWASFFIGKGADVNSANREGETPLILATRNSSEQAVDMLIKSNAKVDQSNRVGETALIVAVQLRNPRIAKQLLNAGADPDKADYSGHTARDYAKRDDRDPRMQQLFAPKTSH